MINRGRCNFYAVTSNAFGVNRFFHETWNVGPQWNSPNFCFFILGDVTVSGNFDKVIAIDSLARTGKVRDDRSTGRFDVDIFISTDSPELQNFRKSSGLRSVKKYRFIPVTYRFTG